MTKLEEIARILCQRDGFDPDECVIGVAQPAIGAKGRIVVTHPTPQWQLYWRDVREIVEALREPTKAVTSGVPAHFYHGMPDAEEAWTAMIDALLAEKPETSV